MRISYLWLSGALVLLGCPATPGTDAGRADVSAPPDAVEAVDAPGLDTIDAPGPDAPDTSAASICPRYDAHARKCFGEGTGEDFLAECFALYAGCGDVLPAVVRCRLEAACMDLGRCTGLGC